MTGGPGGGGGSGGDFVGPRGPRGHPSRRAAIGYLILCVGVILAFMACWRQVQENARAIKSLCEIREQTELSDGGLGEIVHRALQNLNCE
jgi:hypothetical protein